MQSRVILAWSVPLASVLVGACGGGGADTPATGATAALAGAGNSAEGIWIGALPNAPTTVAILENGESWSYYIGSNANGIMQGTAVGRGTDFSADFVDDDLLANLRFPVHLSGTVTPRGVIDSVAANGAHIVLSYSATYDHPASLAELA
ncbi:MAG: hypothetical protein NVS2B4_04880 [Ramlibacter sp.]